MDTREKPHGFIRPFSKEQIISWVLFALNLLAEVQVIYIVRGKDMLNEFWRWVIVICTITSNFFLFYTAVRTTGSDPSDRTVHLERYCKFTKQDFDESKYEFWCSACMTNVLENSKHCGKC